MSSEPVRVGVVGLGRSGYNIHVKTIREMPEQFEVVAVTDNDPARCATVAAEIPGCRAYDTPDALFADDAVELAVIATPNILHVDNTVAALEKGRHVLCEKPFGLSVAEVDRMIAAREAASQRAGRPVCLAPFHNLRFDESFVAVREILASGLLGDILQIRLAAHHFTRRWDWQTLRAFGGGQLYNLGSHILDLGMDLLSLFGVIDPDDIDLSADLRAVLTCGDTEDHGRLTLRSRSDRRAPLLDIEITAACAYPQDRYFVMGSRGGLHGTTTHLEWKWIVPSELVPRHLTSEAPADRTYPREDVPWHEAAKDCDATPSGYNRRYYKALYPSLRADGAPPPVTAEEIRRRLAIIERAYTLSPVESAAGDAVGK